MKIVKDEKNYIFVSETGGTVTNLVLNGFPIIYPQKIIGEKLRGGIPICFPFFGPPKSRYSSIRQHGWLRDEILNCIKSNSTLSFEGKSLGREDYPWHMHYRIDFTLTKEGVFRAILFMERLKDGVFGRAPVNPGFHPYFSNLGKRSVFLNGKEKTSFSQSSEIINIRENLIIDLGKTKVELSLEGDFGEQSCFVLWSDSEDYFCVEPVMQYPSYFATKKGKFLDEEESLTLILYLAASASR